MLESAREVKKEKQTARKSAVIECFVYQGEELLGWDCFAQQSVSVGRNAKADIVLEEETIADVHAVFYVTGNEITVFNINIDDSVRVNDELVSTRSLGTMDFVKIGPYTMKVKIQKPSSLSTALTESDNHLSRDTVLEQSVSITEDGMTGIELDAPEKPVDKDTGSSSLYQDESRPDASHDLDRDCLIENETRPSVMDKNPAKTLEEEKNEPEIFVRDNAQSNTMIEPEQETETTISIHHTSAPGPEHTVTEECLDEIEAQFQKKESVPYDFEEETEEDDEDDEGDLPLFLRDRLMETNHFDSASVTGHVALEVIKFRDDHVYDICFLDHKEKYHSGNGKTKFCLAENKSRHECYFYFTKQFMGQICTGNVLDTDIVDLCISENVHHKRKEIYRSFVPKKGTLILTDDYYSYLIRRVVRSKSPHVAASPRPDKRLNRSLVHSAGFHFVIMLLLTLFVALPTKQHLQEPESRFVHIDTAKLKKKEPAKPQKKKVMTEKPVIKKAEKPKKVPKKKKVVRTRKKTVAQKGNVKKRNIKKAGILSLIGTSAGIIPKEALASVTNLDTVSAPRMSDENFRVAGIADKLDSPDIELPVGDVLKTRGSSQVLRSAGTKGEGRIAELNEGTAGQKGVKGMVSVELDNKVRVQGGMSREAVKRVIDQHMEEVTYCYETALMGNPSLAGSIVFEWKILLSGKVGEVGIKTSSVKSDIIHSCIKRAIKTWQFPKPTNTEVIVSYPFVFDIVGF